MAQNNLDAKTVAGFGDEWSRFDQSDVPTNELRERFAQYFELFPWEALPSEAIGFDVGCGSGRWAQFVLSRVGKLHCLDASDEALEVAKKNLKAFDNCVFHHASVGDMPIINCSMDFGYSLGVLHHIPDSQAGLDACCEKLKPGAPFLLYVYYAFDGRPAWFQLVWRVSDIVRRAICRAPMFLRYSLSQAIAVVVYFPLARLALLCERLGCNVAQMPLAEYRQRSFYTMRTDALDRFGTKLEQRFTAKQIRTMMEHAGLERIQFRDGPPYWCALGYKKSSCAALPE